MSKFFNPRRMKLGSYSNWVPGANEGPLAADLFAKSKKFDAIVVLGVVIEGATPHASLITSQVENSLASISRETEVPILNGVIAARNLEQAIERSGTKAGNRGWNTSVAAIEMANLYRQIRDELS